MCQHTPRIGYTANCRQCQTVSGQCHAELLSSPLTPTVLCVLSSYSFYVPQVSSCAAVFSPRMSLLISVILTMYLLCFSSCSLCAPPFAYRVCTPLCYRAFFHVSPLHIPSLYVLSYYLISPPCSCLSSPLSLSRRISSCVSYHLCHHHCPLSVSMSSRPTLLWSALVSYVHVPSS